MLRKNLEGLSAPAILKRGAVQRDFRAAVRGESAKQALGEIAPNCELFGFTKGQFSLVDLLDAILWQTGPADVALSTWTAATADLTRVKAWLASSRLRSCRFLVDYSFERRQPGFCETLREEFGDDAIRVTVTHAKFALIRNAKWDLVVRTSMNLNFNPRFENFEISGDRAFADFLGVIIEEVWATQDAGEGFAASPAENKRSFESLFQSGAAIGGDLHDLRDVAG